MTHIVVSTMVAQKSETAAKIPKTPNFKIWQSCQRGIKTNQFLKSLLNAHMHQYTLTVKGQSEIAYLPKFADPIVKPKFECHQNMAN